MEANLAIHSHYLGICRLYHYINYKKDFKGILDAINKIEDLLNSGCGNSQIKAAIGKLEEELNSKNSEL